jgi:hypothetical protein
MRARVRAVCGFIPPAGHEGEGWFDKHPRGPQFLTDTAKEGPAMKVNVEIECTPEEARQFMGLPNLSKANEVYVEQFANAMRGVSNVDQLQEYARNLAPMGQFGLKLFQNFMENSANFAEGAGLGESGSKKSKGD